MVLQGTGCWSFRRREIWAQKSLCVLGRVGPVSRLHCKDMAGPRFGQGSDPWRCQSLVDLVSGRVDGIFWKTMLTVLRGAITVCWEIKSF